MHRIGNGAAIYLTVVAVAFAWIMVEIERINIREIKKGMEKPSISKEKESDGFCNKFMDIFDKKQLGFSQLCYNLNSFNVEKMFRYDKMKREMDKERGCVG